MGKLAKNVAMVAAGAVLGGGLMAAPAAQAAYNYAIENNHVGLRCDIAATDTCRMVIKTGSRAGEYRLKFNNNQISQIW